MSGGVDSSVTACLLKEQGWDVIGITMKLFDTGEEGGAADTGSCCGFKGISDARRVCQSIDAPYYVLNFAAEFREKVIEYYTEEYLAGRTPIPCIPCNKELKFGRLLEKTRSLDVDFIATGHYARIEKEGETAFLKTGIDPVKDQSYFLSSTSQDQLRRIMFPLGGMTKEEVRSRARGFGLHVHDKPGSQEACFIPNDDYRSFIKTKAPEKLQPGPMMTVDGEAVGEHKGLALYTIGQRKGLGISRAEPTYVIKIDRQRNTVIIGGEKDTYGNILKAGELNWCSGKEPGLPVTVTAKIRYNHPGAAARVTASGEGQVQVEFDEPQKSITPGQAVVFYDGELVLGGGIISDSESDENC